MPKVLVVDDERLMVRLLSLTLPKTFEIVEAHDGKEAIRLAEHHHPDLILLDLNMPEMDGFAVLSHIRKTEGIAKTPVVVVTGRKSDEDREFMMQLGANAYLTKPFSPSQLLETVNKIIEAKK